MNHMQLWWYLLVGWGMVPDLWVFEKLFLGVCVQLLVWIFLPIAILNSICARSCTWIPLFLYYTISYVLNSKTAYCTYNCNEIVDSFVPITRASVSVCLAYWDIEIIHQNGLFLCTPIIFLGNKNKEESFTFIFSKSVERPWTYIDPIFRIIIPSPPKNLVVKVINGIHHMCDTFIDDGIEITW